jgi:cell surface hyaluronidase
MTVKLTLLKLLAGVLVLTLLISACQMTPPTNSAPDQATPADPVTETPVTETPDPQVEPTITTLKWSDAASWPNKQVPSAGQNLEIPKDTAILLDMSPPALGSVTINGTLVFGDTDINLSADWIMIHDKGRLEVGVPNKPYTHKAVITLTGSASDDIMKMGGRVLGVMGGTLSLIGQERTGWTKLNATANKGDTTITLAETVDWQVGDTIVIASTDFDYKQAEQFTIKSISGNKVTLDKAVQFMHYGQLQNYNGKTLDERAEVGLLSHNIVIQGKMAAKTDTFGGHVMVMSGGQAVVDSVEFFNMGQENKMGRYPIHWHLMGDDSRGQYVRNSSIHDSFNRCVTVHGSNGVKVQNNVTYNIPGHCFFLEDGAEIDNIIENNLGIAVFSPDRNKPAGAPSTALLPSDRSFPGPAVYWITHPRNIVRNNVAAGSSGTGFWYAFPEHPTGPSVNATIYNRYTPLAEFKSNVAHGHGADGLHVDNGPKADVQKGTDSAGYTPHVDPNAFKTEYGYTRNISDPVTAVFDSFVAYKNRRNGVWLRGQYHLLQNPVLADNAVGATFASDESILRGGLVVGETANLGTATASEWEAVGPTDGRSLPKPWKKYCNPEDCFAFAIRGFEFYDGTVGVEDTHFAGFSDNTLRKASALSYLNFTAFSTSPQNYAKGLSFAPGTKKVNLFTRGAPIDPSKDTEDGYRSAVFMDKDGTVTGTANRAVVVNNPLLITANCSENTDWSAWICNESYVGVALATETDIASLTLSLGAATHTLYGSGNSANNYFRSVLRPQQTYGVSFQGGVPSKFRLVLADAPKEWLRFEIPLGAAPSKVSGYNVKPAASLDALANSTLSTYFYDTTTQLLHVKLAAMSPWNIGKGLDYVALEVEL